MWKTYVIEHSIKSVNTTTMQVGLYLKFSLLSGSAMKTSSTRIGQIYFVMFVILSQICSVILSIQYETQETHVSEFLGALLEIVQDWSFNLYLCIYLPNIYFPHHTYPASKFFVEATSVTFSSVGFS